MDMDKERTTSRFNSFMVLDSDSDSEDLSDTIPKKSDIREDQVSTRSVNNKVSTRSVEDDKVLSSRLVDPHDLEGWTTVQKTKSKDLSKFNHKEKNREPLSEIIAAIDKKTLVDKVLLCKDCKEDFGFVVKQQHYFLINRWNDPTRCYKCRKQKKQDRALEKSNNREYCNSPNEDFIVEEKDILHDENIIIIRE